MLNYVCYLKVTLIIKYFDFKNYKLFIFLTVKLKNLNIRDLQLGLAILNMSNDVQSRKNKCSVDKEISFTFVSIRF